MIHLFFACMIFFALPQLNKKVPFFLVSFIGILFFLGSRFNYGNDYSGYLHIYNEIEKGNFAWGSSDLLFKWLNQISPSFQFLIILVSLLYVYTIYFLVRKNLKIEEYWVALVVLIMNPYLFLIHLSSLRQTIAICFFVFAIHFAKSRNPVSFSIFVLIASGFHSTAILLLPVYFIMNHKGLSNKFVKNTIIAVVILIATPIVDIVLIEGFKYFPFYKHYYLTGAQNSIRSTVLSGLIFWVILANVRKMDLNDLIYGKLAVIFGVISLLALKLSMLSRVGMYFEIFMIIVVPKILSINDKSWKKYVIISIIFGIYLLRYVSFFANPVWGEFYGTYDTIFFR